MAIAASLTKPMTLARSLSYRVATRRNCFSLLKKRSMRLRFFVEINVVRALDFAVAFWRDDDFAATFDNLIVQVIGVVAFVGDHGGGGEPVDEFVE
jgi:hypothetical protein